jgi:hypothetical protein
VPLEVLAPDEKGLITISGHERRDPALRCIERVYFSCIDANGRASKLFQIPTDPVKHTVMLPKINWLSGERYVMMVVDFTQKPVIVVMDPASGKMGRLTSGKKYAWYQQRAAER